MWCSCSARTYASCIKTSRLLFWTSHGAGTCLRTTLLIEDIRESGRPVSSELHQDRKPVVLYYIIDSRWHQTADRSRVDRHGKDIARCITTVVGTRCRMTHSSMLRPWMCRWLYFTCKLHPLLLWSSVAVIRSVCLSIVLSASRGQRHIIPYHQRHRSMTDYWNTNDWNDHGEAREATV